MTWRRARGTSRWLGEVLFVLELLDRCHLGGRLHWFGAQVRGFQVISHGDCPFFKVILSPLAGVPALCCFVQSCYMEHELHPSPLMIAICTRTSIGLSYRHCPSFALHFKFSTSEAADRVWAWVRYSFSAAASNPPLSISNGRLSTEELIWTSYCSHKRLVRKGVNGGTKGLEERSPGFQASAGPTLDPST